MELFNDLRLTSDRGESVRCRLADDFLSRLIGLMGQQAPPKGKGILIRPCKSIHMFFMRFAIDAVFLDRNFYIVKLIRNLKPGKIIYPVPDAWQVLEVESGSLPASFTEGMRLTVNAI